MTLRVSWSSLRTHMECRQKGYLTRTGRKATLQDKRNFLPGNVVDRVVRNWLNDDPEHNLGAMPGMVADMLDVQRKEMAEEGGVIRSKQIGDTQQIIDDCVEAVTRIEPALLKYVVPYDYQPDFKFQAPLSVQKYDGTMETVYLIGYMDILVHDDRDRWWVWDVKMTADDQYWRKTVGQLSFYDLAVELLFGKPTVRTGLLQPMCTRRVFPYEVNPQRRVELMQSVMTMANDIWRDDRTPISSSEPCWNCEVKHACTKFQPVVQADGSRRVSLGAVDSLL